MQIGTINGSKIATLRDAGQLGESVEQWQAWFTKTVQELVESVDEDRYVIFYQTDRRYRGHLISKLNLVVNAAESVGAKLVFHKTAVRPGRDTRRPTQAHLICVSKKGTGGQQSADWFEQGYKIEPNGIDEESLAVAIDFLETH